MPAEWQTRQFRLVASASCPPGNLRSPLGRVTLTDFSGIGLSVCAERSDSIPPAAIAMSNILDSMPSSLSDGDRCLFDDVAHEAGGIPVRRGRLRFALAIGASRHEHLVSGSRWREGRLPLAETV